MSDSQVHDLVKDCYGQQLTGSEDLEGLTVLDPGQIHREAFFHAE